MKAWRLGIAVLGAVVLAAPLLGPLVLVSREPQAWRVWGDFGRLGVLAGNTLALTIGTLSLCFPLGTLIAALLFRTDLSGRAILRALFLVFLFVPAPLLAAGWQSATGALPGGLSGLAPAVLLHAVAGLPWIVLIAGHGLISVERDLEEDALTAAGPWRVFWLVTLPRSAPALSAAALWVGLQVAGEITFTDLFQVRTYAEETYTQFVAPEPDAWQSGDALARALAVSLPPSALLVLVLVAVTRRWERLLPPALALRPPLQFSLGRWHAPVAVALGFFAIVLLGAPLLGLLARAGMSGTPADWSVSMLLEQVTKVVRADATLLLGSLVLAVSAGLLAASLGLALCWASRDDVRLWFVFLPALTLIWALPGPVLGLGLKQAINGVLDATDSRWLEAALYLGPSPLPLLWVDVVRFLPCAVALLWTVVRLLPRDLSEAARLDGAGPFAEFRHVVWPATRASWAGAALVVAVLSLGELSAGKLVSTPGWPSYGEVLFQRLHYGVTPDLAAGCLVLLGIVVVGAVVVLRLSSPNGDVER